MFCPNCGAEIKDTAKFCTNCGNAIAPPAAPAAPAAPAEPAAPVAPAVEAAAPVVEAAPAYAAPAAPEPVNQFKQPEPAYQPQPQYQAPQPQYEQPQPQYQQPQPQYQQPAPQYQQPQQPPTPPAGSAGPKKKGKLGLIIGIVAAVVVLAVVAILLFSNRLDVYNLEEYLSVEYEGTNGKADAWVGIDWDRLVVDVGTKKGLDLKFAETFEDPKGEWTEIENAFRTISVRTPDMENLSNGDTVNVTISYNNKLAKEAGLKFEGGECQFTVSGLPEIERVDPFEGLEVTFSGNSGDGYVDITYNGPNELIGSYDFEASEYFGLSNGDEITVTFSGYEGFEDFYNFEPTRMENTYVVEGLREIVRNMSDISPAWLSSLQACAEEHIRESIADYTSGADYTVGDLEYVGSALIVDDSGYSDNQLYLVFRGIATFKEDGYLPTAIYFPTLFNNVATDGEDPEDAYVFIDGWDYLNYDSYDSTEGYVNPHDFCENIVDMNGADNVVFSGEIANYVDDDGAVNYLADISSLYMGYARDRAKEVSLAEILYAYDVRSSDVTDLKTVGEYLLIDPDAVDETEASILVVIASAHVGGSVNKTLYFPVEYDGVLCFGDYGYTDEYADPWYNNNDELGYDDVHALHVSFMQYMTDYFGVEASPEMEAFAG